MIKVGYCGTKENGFANWKVFKDGKEVTGPMPNFTSEETSEILDQMSRLLYGMRG